MPVDTKDARPVVLAVVIFTVADAFLHFLLEGLGIVEGVPFPSYYVNKLVFGTLIALVILWFWVRAGYPSFGLSRVSFLSWATILLLQVRYAYQGYSGLFHLIFIPAHFAALYYSLKYARVRL